MKTIMGIEYGRGATATVTNAGPALGPAATKKLFPHNPWISVTPDEFNLTECLADRFGENAKIQQKIYFAYARYSSFAAAMTFCSVSLLSHSSMV